jgi:group I intron endonuclease
MDCGIYRILNKKNNKSYIGSSIKLGNRQYKHFWMLSNNKHDNIYLQKSYNKYGFQFFIFEILERCEENLLFERENFYIKKFNSCNPTFGYNQAEVNEFRRNNLNYSTKKKLSIYNLEKNKNFKQFSLTNIFNGNTKIFNNLVDAANYLIENKFSNGKPAYVRQKISYALREKKINNGHKGSIRKTIYKHTFQVIN